MNLQDTHWVITGASAGIGEALAYEAAKNGATRLVLVARRKDRLEEIAASLQREFTNLQIEVLVADLLKAQNCEEITAVAFSKGPIHIWVNNAGMGSNGCFDQLTTSSVLQMLRLNVEALTHLTSLAVKKMREQNGRCAVLQVGSVAGLMPVPTMGLYAATKAFVLSLTDSLSGELAGTNITVHSLNPAPVKTEFLDVANQQGVLTRHQVPMAQSSKAVAKSAVRGLKLNITHIYPWLAMPFPLVAWIVPRFVWRLFGKVAGLLARRQSHKSSKP